MAGSAVFLVDLPTQYLGTMLNIGLVLAISGVALAGLSLPERHPEIFAAGRGRIGPRLMRAASRAVLAMNAFILLLLFAGAPAAGLTVVAIAAAAMLVASRGPRGPQPAPGPGLERTEAPPEPVA